MEIWNTISEIIFFCCISVLAYQDIQRQIVSDIPILIIICVAITNMIARKGIWQVLGIIPAILLFFLAYKQDESGIGGGDIKMIFATGLYYGLFASTIALALASIGAVSMELFINAYYKKNAPEAIRSKSFPFCSYIAVAYFFIIAVF